VNQDSYRATLSYLYALTDWERRPMDRSMRERLLLQRPAALLDRLGNPQRRYISILVAGTKGKGSTSAMLAGILRAAGYRTGLYSQPHLHTYRERIRVDGQMIGEEEVVAGIERIRPHAEALEREQSELGACTTYEVGTALALDFFARSSVDVAVLEVGLGGRLDATNIVQAEMAVITSISYDHTAILGNTLPEIAGEKAGIIKAGRPVLSHPQSEAARTVLARVANERNSAFALGGQDWTWSGDHHQFSVAGKPGSFWTTPWEEAGLSVPLLGQHQLENAATAVAAAHALHSDASARRLPIPSAAISRGLASVRWPGRFEIVEPEASIRQTARRATATIRWPVVVIDGAHNGDSAAQLAAAIRRHTPYERLWLVLGAGTDKDLAAVVAPLAPLTSGAWAVASRHPRSRSAPDVAEVLQHAGVHAQAKDRVAEGVESALAAAGPGDVVCITGSLYVVAEAREALGLVPTDERDPEV
ncbi:MAG TPA: folylpolyglutamate synthase/dihydrofolate synthase family protein, partial [Chloroflexota bacterium]|nr:folylpolyglutamate synthase/dihydrofolate synthase family protein [Chloroflexota bacterium]